MNFADITKGVQPWMVLSGLVLLAAFAGGAFLLLRGESGSGFSFDQGSVSMLLSDVRLVHGKEGRKLWELSAEESVLHQDNDSVSLTNPQFVFIIEDREGTVSVNASRGRLVRNRREVRLWPDVQVRQEGSVLTADSMEYLESEGTLAFSGQVRLLDPRMSVRSRKARFNLQNRDLFLWHEVKMVLQ